MSIIIIVDKYTFIAEDNELKIKCLRHGEPWIVYEDGGKALLALMCEVEELRKVKITPKLCAVKGEVKLFRYTYKEPISGRGRNRDNEVAQTNWTGASWPVYFHLNPETQTRIVLLKTEEKIVEVEE